MAWDYYEHYPKSAPRAAKGGIKAQSKRGGFGQSWWAKRWIATLESFNIGGRLQRGRSYARSGQVLDIAIEPGVVTAKVQGSQAKPYRVRITVKTLAQGDTATLGAALASQVLFAAKLLAGEMPQDIEQVFKAAKLSLFPDKKSDLQTDCSCPDWSNPCKHVAAVYYLIGEEFDRDPFLLFKLRGIDREQLMALLDTSAQPADEVADEAEDDEALPPTSALRRRRKAKASPAAATSTSATTPEPLKEPLSSEAPAFWQGSTLADDFWGEVQSPPVAAALPKRLGHFPLWRGSRRFSEALEPLYTSASTRGLSLFLGEPDEPRDTGRKS